MIFRSSYRKFAWVGFEPMTTKLCSDALIDWAIRPWVQLATLYSYSISLYSYSINFNLFLQCSRFISVFAFVSQLIFKNLKFNLSMYMLHIRYPYMYICMYIYIYIYIYMNWFSVYILCLYLYISYIKCQNIYYPSLSVFWHIMNQIWT